MKFPIIDLAVNLNQAFTQEVHECISEILGRPLTTEEKGQIFLSFPSRGFEEDSSNLSHANIYAEIQVNYKGTQEAIIAAISQFIEDNT